MDRRLDLLFNRFIPTYAKNYENFKEYQERKNIFVQNVKFIEEQNSLLAGVELKINQFADLRPSEFSQFAHGLELDDLQDADKCVDLDKKVADRLKAIRERPGLGNITIQIDWREKGLVSSVK